MDVSLNRNRDGRGRFFIRDTDQYDMVVFVEQTPRAVYDDYIGIVGKPEKSDATYQQIELPVWNTWAQFYNHGTQDRVIRYAEQLARNGLKGHAIQIDGGWESHRGDLIFDLSRFPDPKAMSDHIHDLGFEFGVWVGFWINDGSAHFREAARRGYLLSDAKDPSVPCMIKWWAGSGGLVDLANPKALAWFAERLHELLELYRIDGLKFDTRFFDQSCNPYQGHTPIDYLSIAAAFVDRFDLQGVGVRFAWGSQARRGFVTRAQDQDTNWSALRNTVSQTMALLVTGYPFVEPEMVGGSQVQPPPSKEVLVRWAQANSLMPLMYCSTLPLEVREKGNGKMKRYDGETVDLYRTAIDEHEALAPYIWSTIRKTLKTGEPIMKPLFLEFPNEDATYTLDDEWLLGDGVLAAPVLADSTERDVYIPTGRWHDVRKNRTVDGPTRLRGYDAPLGVMPAFVRMNIPGADEILKVFR